MQIIVDKKLPAESKIRLIEEAGVRSETEVFLTEISTEGIVYPAISGHPDIFLCKISDKLIVAPNLPAIYYTEFTQSGVNIVKGNQQVGVTTHNSSCVHYNAAVGEHHLVHRLEYTDPVILEQGHFLKKIMVKQGYSRCNLLFLKNDNYITSDPGIDVALKNHDLEGLYVSPKGILLPGFENGFIGGCMGVLNDIVFVTGNLDLFADGHKVKAFLKKLNYTIVELSSGPLYDSGSIIFI